MFKMSAFFAFTHARATRVEHDQRVIIVEYHGPGVDSVSCTGE